MTIFSDTDFPLLSTDGCSLSGQIDCTGLSYAVTDGQGQCKVLKTLPYPRAVLTYDDWAEELNRLFTEEPVLTQPFKTSRWAVLSNKATLLPASFAAPEYLRKALAYAVALDELDEIHYRPLPAYESVAVFAVPSPPAGVILKYQRDTQFFHPLIQLLSLPKTPDGHPQLFFSLLPELAVVALFGKDNELWLSNACPVQTFADALYCLLSVVQRHHLEQAPFTLYYTGAFTETDENTLRRYIPRAQYLYGNHAGRQMGGANASLYHLLLTLPLCE